MIWHKLHVQIWLTAWKASTNWRGVSNSVFTFLLLHTRITNGEVVSCRHFEDASQPGQILKMILIIH